MARTKGSSGEKTLLAIRKAGLKLIYQHGYEAMSLRDLARAVGIQQGSLYNHIETKQALLFDLMRGHLEKLVTELDARLAGAADPVARLRIFIDFHLTYHMERKSEVYINNSELRSLEPQNLVKIKALRKAYETRLIDILKDGQARKLFSIADASVTAFALIAMLTGVCAWYKPKGPLSQAELVNIHTDLIQRGVVAAA
ncbi:MAG: TetR family transcriptional regulator [Rhodospirillaceae bacterium]|nr:TetR family transcriptional regulator [Rhodospirillaceae bacterium]